MSGPEGVCPEAGMCHVMSLLCVCVCVCGKVQGRGGERGKGWKWGSCVVLI